MRFETSIAGLAFFAPGMKMIADVDGIEARLFRRHRVFE
jgi:hypothetical protein